MAERVLLAVFAHPDDETFRPGGTLALLARSSVRVHLLTATHGEMGACGDPPLCARKELPALRERELACACAALGIEPAHLLDYRDGDLADADVELLIAQILAGVANTGARILLSFGLDGISGHSDHVAIGYCAAEAYRRDESLAALYTVAVPVSLAQALGMHQLHAVSDVDIALSVDVTTVWEAKQAAIRCHATQVGATPLLQAPLEVQRRFFGVEHFVRAAVRRDCDDFFSDVLRRIPSRGRPEI